MRLAVARLWHRVQHWWWVYPRIGVRPWGLRCVRCRELGLDQPALLP